MSAIADKARAFAVIADMLSTEERARVAGHIANLIAPNTKSNKEEPKPLFEAPRAESANEIDGQMSVGAFLESKGFTGPGQVKAAGRLTAWLSAEWVRRYGDDDKQPTGFVPLEHLDLLEWVYSKHEAELYQYRNHA